jgi:hypothetical protein
VKRLHVRQPTNQPYSNKNRQTDSDQILSSGRR